MNEREFTGRPLQEYVPAPRLSLANQPGKLLPGAPSVTRVAYLVLVAIEPACHAPFYR